MTPDGTAPQQVIRMAVEDAFQEGYRAGMNDGHDLSLKTTEAQHRETKDEIVRAALASPGPTDGCPCTIVTPCHPMCSCARPMTSGGCQRCAKYGSPEQRWSAAERIAQSLSASPGPTPPTIPVAAILAGLDTLAQQDKYNGLQGETCRKAAQWIRAHEASPGPRREPPPDLLAEAEKCARTIYVATDRDVADHVSGVIVRLVQCIREAHLVDAVGRVPLTEPRLADLLYECPDLWTAGDTDPQDREIYTLAAKWLLPRLATPPETPCPHPNWLPPIHPGDRPVCERCGVERASRPGEPQP